MIYIYIFQDKVLAVRKGKRYPLHRERERERERESPSMVVRLRC